MSADPSPEARAIARLKSQFAASHVIATLVANAHQVPVDAVAVFAGLNNDARLAMGVRATRQTIPAKGGGLTERVVPLLVTGTNDEERRRDGDIDFGRVMLELGRLGVGFRDKPPVILAEPEGPHVPCQVWNLLNFLGLLPNGRKPFKYGQRDVPALPAFHDPLKGIVTVGLVADAWHMDRVVLTLVRQILRGVEEGWVDRQALLLRIVPIACPCALEGPFGAISTAHLATGYRNVLEASASETTRLANYVDDVGDLDDLLRFLSGNGQYQPRIVEAVR